MADISTEAETNNEESPPGEAPPPLAEKAAEGDNLAGDPGAAEEASETPDMAPAPPDSTEDESSQVAVETTDESVEDPADITSDNESDETRELASSTPDQDIDEEDPDQDIDEEDIDDEADDADLPDTTQPQVAPENQAGLAPDSSPPSVLQSRYDIHPSRPLLELDSPSARAYEVEDRMQPLQKLFALICIPGMPVRWEEIEEIAEHEIPFNLPLVAYGNVDWPLLGQKCLALIYQRPLGGRVSKLMKSRGVSDYKKVDIIRSVVEAGMNGLQQLSFRDITHRSIRPDNLFFMDEDYEDVVLGSFVTSPPGFDQPLAFETIPRSMAYEGGRGVGDTSDDLYAFGATLAFLVQKNNPVKGMGAEELILSKLSESSYQTLVGNALLTSTLMDPLRGLLQDDPASRWGFEELEIWSDGRRVTAAHVYPPNHAQRPYKFGDYDHFTARTLAYSMSKRPESALKMIKDGTLTQWISRGLEDNDLNAAVEAAIEVAKVKASAHPQADDLLLTRILLIMDPLAPIHYKSIALMHDAFGGSLGVELLRGEGIRTLAEAIINEAPQIWFDMQDSGNATYFNEVEAFQELRLHLQKAGPGFGIERCLYLTNPGFPCQSPLVKAENIIELDDLIPTLNLAEKTVDTKKNPVDRHIAAFIAARIQGSVDAYLGEIADLDKTTQILGSLRLLAHLQERLNSGPQHGLSKWLGSLMGPVIKIYQSRKTRKAIEGEIPRIVRTGDLNELLNLMDDAETRHIDEAGYAAALEEFSTAEDEIVKIEIESGPNSDAAAKTSKQAAAVTSILIMIFLISVMIMSG